MKPYDSPWEALSAAARARWPKPAPGGAPPLGFHSRVLSRLSREETASLELWWRMSLRALPLAAVIVLLCWAMGPTVDWEPDLAEIVMEEALPW